MRTGKVIAGVAGAAAVAGLLAWAFWPRPVAVDLAPVVAGPMQVTVAADGVTRIREPYLVTAPVAGTTTRMPVQVGDAVVAGETVVAVIQPLAPAFLDARARAQAEAAVGEAEAALRVAEARLAQARTDLTHAETEHGRYSTLAARGAVPARALEDAQAARDAARAAAAAAQSAVDLQQAALLRARAQLLEPAGNGAASSACCVELRAPHTGTVLEVENLSARPVTAGAPLLTIGDLADLEIVADLLSADAVRVAPGAPALVDRWGGPGTIHAVVRRVDPSAFTKVSALGIEEQRVRVRLDLVTPAEERAGLGEAYRVHVRVVVWEAAEVVQVPLSAIFRAGEGWAVFREAGGRALLTPVGIGRQTQTDVQILSGLTPGERVVAFPGNAVENGTRIAAREDG